LIVSTDTCAGSSPTLDATEEASPDEPAVNASSTPELSLGAAVLSSVAALIARRVDCTLASALLAATAPATAAPISVT